METARATRPLLDTDLIESVLTRSAAWCGSHGADGDYLGTGLLYYALVYAKRARVAVCLGSGGGFVPRLMRQAQRDLELDDARTILVDANAPQAGWGAPDWLGEDSFFRTSFPDVELVIERSGDAARRFAAEGVAIDYLHIDADHSFEGCLADFDSYRPLLSAGAVVTLHDTSYPGAGVHGVVEQLRGRPDCEVVDFSEQGAGTAVVRIVAAEDPARIPAATAAGEAVQVTRRPDAPVLEPPSTEWAYLRSEAFQMRNSLAAHLVRNREAVVEIGGWRTPIDGYLTGAHRSVLVVDPFIRELELDTLNGSPCAVRHVRARFQDLDWHVARPGAYGLVILGLEIQDLSDEDYRALFELVEKAGTVVVEFPSDWEPSCEQYRRILANAAVEERAHVRLDFSGNDFGDLTGSWPPRVSRELHVLEGRYSAA